MNFTPSDFIILKEVLWDKIVVCAIAWGENYEGTIQLRALYKKICEMEKEQ